MGVSLKDVCILGKEGVGNNTDKSGQGKGDDMAVNGHPLQYGLLSKERAF